MARFGFIGPTYQSESPNSDAEDTVNWYPEVVEGQGRSAMALYPCPGIAVLWTLNGPIRGLFTINGRVFAVGGSTLYELFINGTSNAISNALVNDGQLASICASNTQLLVASGGTLYVFNLQTGIFSANVSNGVFANAIMCGYSDGFFVALLASSGQFYVSAPEDATTWGGVNIATTIVSVFADNVLAMIVDHRELAMLGPKAGVVYYDSGNTFPFDVAPGSYIEGGIIGPWAWAKLDNSVFWIGADERGAGIAFRNEGYTPTRVSNHAVETAWQQYTTIADARCYAYQDHGHTFFVCYFPTANKTWVYDVATQLWHRRAYLNPQNGQSTAHLSQCHCFGFEMHLVGDWSSGNVYEMSKSILTDNGNPIKRIRRAPHVSNGLEWIFHHQLEVDLETGLGPIPPLTNPSVSPTTIILTDSNDNNWSIQVSPTGVLESFLGGAAPSPGLFLNDPTNATSWQVGVDILGQLTTTEVTLNPNYPSSVQFVSSDGSMLYGVGVTINGALTTTSLGLASGPRDPQAFLRWSNDGGHTWSNYYAVGAGQAGNFSVRAVWRRLGRARVRCYELSVSDPIPWRVVDAYLLATPGYLPGDRLAQMLRKIE